MTQNAVLAFSSPGWLVLALFLPLLWYLLRVTPPPPASLTFPGFPLLAGLKDADREAAQTPLFLLVLRFLLLLLLIIALSGPVYRPMNALEGNGPLVVVIDNGWASANRWSARITAAKSLITKAANEKRTVVLATTAPTPDGHAPQVLGPMAARSVLAKLAGLAPRPWPTAPEAMAAQLQELRDTKALEGQCPVYWFYDGLAQDRHSVKELMQNLQTFGVLTLVYNNSGAEKTGVSATGMITGISREGEYVTAELARPAALKKLTEPVTLLLKDKNGGVLARHSAVFEKDKTLLQARIHAPPKLANRAQMLVWQDYRTAGHSYLLDNSFVRPSTALVLPEGQTGSSLPLLDAAYYIEKAVKPFTDFASTSLSELDENRYAVIIAPDMPTPAADISKRLEHWVSQGGILVRFAGPDMMAAFVADPGKYDALLPVPLRLGSRSMGGIMTWNTPAKLDPFAKDTPFAGLTVPDDVHIRTQVLAEPSADLFARTWARLKDGTPLVTAKQHGSGYIVFVHTTANAQWTNLPLSGLFVQFFKRIVHLSRPVTIASNKNGLTELQPVSVLDGFGNIVPPWPQVQALPIPRNKPPAPASSFGHVLNPPGLYAAKQVTQARNLTNLGNNLLRTTGKLPLGISTVASDDLKPEKALADSLFLLALWLFVLELVVSFAIRGLFRSHLGPRFNATSKRPTPWVIVLFCVIGTCCLSNTAQARTLEIPQDIIELNMPSYGPPKRKNPPDEQVHSDVSTPSLGYVVTGHPQTDAISEAGLFALSEQVRKRTTTPLGNPKPYHPGVDAPDALILIYWPVLPQAMPLGQSAANDINRYMKNGGLVVFDTQDQDRHEAGLERGPNLALATLSQGLGIPPLIRLPDNHVLSRSFFLLQDGFPGRFDGGDLWLARLAKGRTIDNADIGPTTDTTRKTTVTLANDNVSPVLIGANNWAGAWATDSAGNPLFAVVPGGHKQREMAYRFGVNLVMYALTGNYKSDQVHVNALIERMKR